MASAPTESHPLWYVYGIVSSDSLPETMPAGVDDARVSLEQRDGVAALVSVLDDADYTPEALELKSGDVEWLSPRAVAHDRVLTWASDHAAVVPLPMFSLFSGKDAVHTMLRDRATQLSSVLARVGAGREYALRVHRVDDELLAVMPSLSPRLAELVKSAESASPGQRYLLERKLDGEKKSEMRSVTQRVVEEIVNSLAPSALAVARSPIPRVSEADAARGTMVLNAAFLVAHERLEEFQKTLTRLVGERGAEGAGFRFDFTGPWPPYHFVTERADGE
jgi:gas vesicle protein GvpL/GvpF